MKFRVLRSTCCVIIFLASCTGQRPGTVTEDQTKTKFASDPATNSSLHPPLAPKEKRIFSKELNESLHFAASLERESLRLISKNNSFEATTLFSTLSYAFEIASGIKRSAPGKIDCSRFQIKAGPESTLEVYKVCQKPNTLVAILVSSSNESRYKVTFHIKEWASVVGLSVTLTNPDIVCEIKIKEKKLQEFSCDNWAYFLSSSDASATEVHLKTFTFQRDQTLQLKLSGGFFRDLIERTKIEVKVPLQGKIELIEKEIDVKDDFAERPKTQEEAHGEKNKEKNEEYQKFIKTEDGVKNQNAEQGEGPKTSEAPRTSEVPQQGEIEVPRPEAPVENSPENNLENVEFPSATNPVAPNEIEQGENAGGVPKQNPRGTRGR